MWSFCTGLEFTATAAGLELIGVLGSPMQGIGHKSTEAWRGYPDHQGFGYAWSKPSNPPAQILPVVGSKIQPWVVW